MSKIPTPEECLKLSHANEIRALEEAESMIASEVLNCYLQDGDIVNVAIPAVNRRVAHEIVLRARASGWTATYKDDPLTVKATTNFTLVYSEASTSWYDK